MLALTCLLAASSCGSARQVKREARGGIIAIHGERHESMKEAREMMLEHCRGPYQIVEEGEMKVAGGKRTEWRLRYRCDLTPRKVAESDGGLPPSPDDGYPQAPAQPPPAQPDGAPASDAGTQPDSTSTPDPEE
jgi:hypothetical protein